MDRGTIIEIVMRETTDDIVADGWDHLGKPNILVQGCKFVRGHGHGYADPDGAARNFAGFIADALIAATAAEQSNYGSDLKKDGRGNCQPRAEGTESADLRVTGVSTDNASGVQPVAGSTQESAVCPALGEPWRVMTREEYLALSLKGPIAVDANYDGFGGVAVWLLAGDAPSTAEPESSDLPAQNAWDWLAGCVGLELSWDEVDEGEAAWLVHRVNGGRSDREWTLIATGETPLAAVQAAQRRLPTPPKAEGA